MVAYSFQQRFAPPILAGTKRQTIRADRKRHARRGELVQLFTGMRTRQCTLLGVYECDVVLPIRIRPSFGKGFVWIGGGGPIHQHRTDLDHFATQDGFADWPDMVSFWQETHPPGDTFNGWLIRWT